MARNSKKKKDEVIEELPHLTPEEQADIDVRTAKVNIRILEAKALQLELQNREKIIMLDAKAGQHDNHARCEGGTAHVYRHSAIGVFKWYGLLRFGASPNARPSSNGLQPHARSV